MKLNFTINPLIFIAILSFILGYPCKAKIPQNKDIEINIPLDLSTQRPVLELMIQGEGPYRFIFDTGSSGSIIDEELAMKMNLEVIGEHPLHTPGSDITLMSKKVKVPEVSFPNTDIFEERIMNTMAIRKILPVDGILSPVFFSDYIITLDYVNSNLILSMDDLKPQDIGVVPFTAGQQVINFNVSIDGNIIEAHLDSGNPGGFDIPYSLKDKLNFIQKPSEAGIINTPVASFKKWKTTLSGEIEIGGVIYKNPEVNLVEGFKFVNLGFNVYRDLVITIDRKNSLIKFEKSNTVIANNIIKESESGTNDYTGWYGNHEREIFIEDGEMYLQRNGAPKLKLVKLDYDEYEMMFDMSVRNELPNVKFKRDETNSVIGLTFLFKDGRQDFIQKD